MPRVRPVSGTYVGQASRTLGAPGLPGPWLLGSVARETMRGMLGSLARRPRACHWGGSGLGLKWAGKKRAGRAGLASLS